MNPLDQLADIHLPPPIGFWPLAWGWWLMLAIVLVSILGVAYWGLKIAKKNAYRKQALHELANLQNNKNTSASTFVQQTNQILHRCALHHPVKNISLAGEAWLSWLDQQCKQSGQQFSEGIGRALLNGPYQADFTLNEKDQQLLHDLAINWIKKHQFLSTQRESQQNV